MTRLEECIQNHSLRAVQVQKLVPLARVPMDLVEMNLRRCPKGPFQQRSQWIEKLIKEKTQAISILGK